MRYEPGKYILEYELCAIVFLVVILARYFAARRFPNQKNRLFSFILWVVLTDMVLDIVGSLTIEHVRLVPLPVTYIVNGMFYSLQILLPILMVLYTLAMVKFLNWERIRNICPAFLPGLITLAAMFLNPLTHWFFYVDPTEGYIHGPLFIYTYFICLFYMVFTFLVAFQNRAALRKEEYLTIYRFLAIGFVAMAVQYLYPALLLSGVAIALAVILMYFTIQNPDGMIDMTTGAFTYEAMLAFLRDRMQERDHVQLVAIKIHNMSRINDLLGIENGSLLLRQVLQFLSAGATDTWVFRMRGSCFVAVTRQKKDYYAIRTRLEKHISEPWIVNGTEVLLQAAMCCVETDELLEDPISPEEAVNYLETAFAQNEGRSERIVSIDVGSELLDRIKRYRSIETTLRDALTTGEGLELHFQPLWSVRQARYVSVEVLLRFQHPVFGYISPDEFVAIAENNGFVTTLDEFVVRKACAFIQAHDCLKDYGIETVEINLSALEFMHRRLPELLMEILTQYEVDPHILCFEITETAATESFQLLQSCMSDILGFGCHFALDDFGTGYANISQVIQLPFSIVKLDKSMLYGPPAVLEDIVHMFTRIDRRTVIEGIETAEQVELVKSFEVDVIQGFYYARPMNGEAFIRFLQQENDRAQTADNARENIHQEAEAVGC